MNIEYFQNNEKKLQVSLDFLEKWAEQVELAFQNWSSKLINKNCINEFNKPKEDIDIEIMAYVEKKFQLKTGKSIRISEDDKWLYDMTGEDLNLILNILQNLPNCEYFNNIVLGIKNNSISNDNNLKGYNVTHEDLEQFTREFGLYSRRWQNDPKNSSCVNSENKILPKFQLYMDKYFEIEIEKKTGKKIEFRKFKWMKNFSKEELDILLNITSNVPDCISLRKIIDNDTLKENNIISEEDSDPKNLLIRKISAIKEDYYNKNKKSFKSFIDNRKLYSSFLRGYQLYLEHGFKNALNEIPSKSSEDNMSYQELNVYYSLLKLLPDIKYLITEGSMDINNTPKVNQAIIQNGLFGKGNNIMEEDDLVAEEDDLVAEEEDLVNIKLSKKSKITYTKKPEIPGVGTTTITSITRDNPPSITTVLHKNRGKVESNPFGNRKINPSSAPYLKYVNKIGKHLQDINISVKNVSKKLDHKEKKNKKFIESMKNLITEKEMNNRIIAEEEESLDNTININPHDKLYHNANSGEYKLLSHNSAQKMVNANNEKNISYQNNVKFNHMEPSKKIMSAYGWSYMPPQHWSVPQKRPPVCIPSKENRTKIMPLLDKGVPVDALDWKQVGSILPKFEYSEHYNPDYYYPGWKSQKNVKYPKFNSGKNFSNKYYNYNRAEKTNKQ